MKKNEQRVFYTSTHTNTGVTKPMAPVAARQAVNDRRSPDPSSVLRSDRYPIPSSFEYRMRSAE
jgi:hypothetical protein